MGGETKGQYQAYRRRGKRAPPNSVDSLPNSSSEVCADQIGKRGSCQSHISVDAQANKKRTGMVEDEQSGGLVLRNLVCGLRRSNRSVIHKNVTEDQNPEDHGDQISEDTARQLRLPTCRRADKKRKCRQKDEDPEVVYPCLGREISKRRANCESEVTPQQKKLDTYMFECYFESLWRSFAEEKRSSFAYLDCLWFTIYTKASSKANVLNWIKKKHVFSKKYVFVPIVRWDHWSLLIFCHFGESLQSKSCTPCMLLLDSLQMANPERLVPDIRKFVLDIYQAEERLENIKQINRIPLKVPKVPQQRNGEECGNFVLYYMKLFIESAPDNFSTSKGKGYPYFMNKDWFTPEGYECFCKTLDSSCR